MDLVYYLLTVHILIHFVMNHKEFQENNFHYLPPPILSSSNIAVYLFL